MTIEDIICSLSEKYGEEFNWYVLPTDEVRGRFVHELKKELGEDNILFRSSVCAVAKCDSNDDVLFRICGENAGEAWRIYHLTYSSDNLPGFPRYEAFSDINAVCDLIEKQFITEFL